ncbi:phage tail protein I, partial [Yersinia enterocolitica]
NGLSINLAVNGAIPINAASYDSDEMTIYPYEWTQYDE